MPGQKRRADRLCDFLGQHGLAGAGLALDQERTLQHHRGIDGDLEIIGGDIVLGAGKLHRDRCLVKRQARCPNRKRPPDRRSFHAILVEIPGRSRPVRPPQALDASGSPAQSVLHVPAILHIAARRAGPGDLARISDADGGAGRRPCRADGGEFLLSVACGAGQGRAQSRQVRSCVRDCLQGSGEPARRHGEGGHSRRMAEEARREISLRGREKADRGDGLGQAHGDAASAPEGSSRVGIRAATSGSAPRAPRRSVPTGYNPEGIRIGQEKNRNFRAVKVWDRREFKDLDGQCRTWYPQHQDRAAAVAQIRPHRRAGRTRSRHYNQGNRQPRLSRRSHAPGAA